MEEIKTKVCAKCKRELPTTEFHRNKVTKDGLQHHCKECNKEYHARRVARKAEASSPSDGLHKLYAHTELAKFTPRQLMEELKARGFKWEYMLEPQRRIMFDKI